MLTCLGSGHADVTGLVRERAWVELQGLGLSGGWGLGGLVNPEGFYTLTTSGLNFAPFLNPWVWKLQMQQLT